MHLLPRRALFYSASPSASAKPNEGISISVDKHVIPSNLIAVIHWLTPIPQNAEDSRKFQVDSSKGAQWFCVRDCAKQKESISRGLTWQASSDYLNGHRLSGA